MTIRDPGSHPRAIGAHGQAKVRRAFGEPTAADWARTAMRLSEMAMSEPDPIVALALADVADSIALRARAVAEAPRLEADW